MAASPGSVAADAHAPAGMAAWRWWGVDLPSGLTDRWHGGLAALGSQRGKGLLGMVALGSSIPSFPRGGSGAGPLGLAIQDWLWDACGLPLLQTGSETVLSALTALGQALQAPTAILSMLAGLASPPP